MCALFKKRKQSTAQCRDQSSNSIDLLCEKFRKVIVSENQVNQARNVIEMDQSKKWYLKTHIYKLEIEKDKKSKV